MPTTEFVVTSAAPVHAASTGGGSNWAALGGSMVGTGAGTGSGIGFAWAAWGQDPTWQSAGIAFASAFAGTIASTALSKGYQAAVEADTAGEAAGRAAGESARRASEAVGRQNNERECARLAAAIDDYNAGHMLAENTIDPRQLEIIKQNVEAVRQAEWELFYAVAGGKLIKAAWGAFEAWRAARVAAALGTRIMTAADAIQVLRPAGSLVGQAGTKSSIRIVQGGAPEAEALFARLTQGGEAIKGTTYPGSLVELNGGGRIGFRPVSTSGPPTIDVFIKGLGIREIKFIP